MRSESAESSASWAQRIDNFEQTALKKHVWGAAVALGLLICAPFSILMFVGITIEDWQAYVAGGPLALLVYFTFRRLHQFGRNGFISLIFALAVLTMGFFYFTNSDAILLERRGYETKATVTRVENRPRAPLACYLQEPDGTPILGSISCRQLDVGDSVTVTVDPIGRVSPKRGSVSSTPVYTDLLVGSGLIMLSVLLGTASGIRKRGTVRRWWPPASPPRNYWQPSSPFPPPPPPPPPPISPPRGPEGAAGSSYE